ncbi:Triose-phosphate Transporter [Actinomortierella ambigua]|uniref:Triose-phosphate Transporter n=1 Tax=Actinomortierella ambigua TaxID=1343610 RepID=A0A9P6Q8F6_9FUNG|nr:Triose-phosphate Transporter [Actinomortierella ambigua]
MGRSSSDGPAHQQPWDPANGDQDPSTSSLLANDEMTLRGSSSPPPAPLASTSASASFSTRSGDAARSTQGRPRGHHRRDDSFGSIASTGSSGSSSSDDGIAWDSSAYGGQSYYDDDTEDSDSAEEDEDDDLTDDQSPSTDDDDGFDIDSDEDTHHLLMKSDRVSGVRTGLRVGETGTGTTIGLDLEDEDEHHFRHRRRSRSLDASSASPDHETLALGHMLRDGRRRQDRQHDAETGQAGGFLIDDDGDHDGQREEAGTVPARKKTTTITMAGKKGKRKKTKLSASAKKKRGQRPLEGLMIRDAVVGAGAIRIDQEQRLAKRQMRVKTLWNVFYVLAWYGCSTTLSFYNKWLFSESHYNFRFPLFTTSLHMVAQFTLSFLTLLAIPSLRPKKAPSPKDFGTKIMPCAVASGLDIGLSNSSLKTITLAFYTMCKSSSLAFVLLFAFLFKLEKPTWKLAGVIGVISIGLFLMVMSEVDFVLIGFIQVMLAAFFGGFRWALTQLLLEKSEANKQGSLANPISTIFFLSPIMGVCLLILSAIIEGFGTIFSSQFFSSFWRGVGILGMLLLGGVIAFLMVLAEFNLIARTSVVSLSVLGIIKEVVTIVISSMVFHDHLTLVNILGLFVTLAGIGFYHYMKLREMKIKNQRLARQAAEEELAKVARMHELEQAETHRRRIHRKLKKQQRQQAKQQQNGGQRHEDQDGLGISTTEEKPTSSTSLPSAKVGAAAKSLKSVRFQQDPLIIHDASDADDEENSGGVELTATGETGANGHNPFDDPSSADSSLLVLVEDTPLRTS